MAKKPVRPTNIFKQYWPILLVIVLVAQTIAIGLLAARHDNSEASDSKPAAENAMAAEINTRATASSLHMLVDPIDEIAYLPELHITLPYDTVSKTLIYNPRTDASGAETGEIDVSSIRLDLPPHFTRVDCAALVRLKVEPEPHPYSPHEQASSVTLSDGRVLQIYQSVNEKECAQAWAGPINPATVAAEFQKAEVY